MEIPEPKAPALNPQGYDPAFLLSDTQMTAYESMTAVQIDDFLANAGAGCRPGKAKEIPLSTGINQEYLDNFQKEYAQQLQETEAARSAESKNSNFTLSANNQRGVPCLSQTRFNLSAYSADTYCPANLPELKNVSAGEIIAAVAKSCRINPQVLLVTLQKEQGLITASSNRLTPVKYQIAMGFACPDHGKCDERFLGFGEQLYYAAKQFQRYRLDPGLYNYRAGRVAAISLGPDEQCPKQELTPKNWATAALYNYTPYVGQTPPEENSSSNSGNSTAKESNSKEANLNSAQTETTTQPESKAPSLPTVCNQRGNFNFWGFYKAWFGDPTK